MIIFIANNVEYRRERVIWENEAWFVRNNYIIIPGRWNAMSQSLMNLCNTSWFKLLWKCSTLVITITFFFNTLKFKFKAHFTESSLALNQLGLAWWWGPLQMKGLWPHWLRENNLKVPALVQWSSVQLDTLPFKITIIFLVVFQVAFSDVADRALTVPEDLENRGQDLKVVTNKKSYDGREKQRQLSLVIQELPLYMRLNGALQWIEWIFELVKFLAFLAMSGINLMSVMCSGGSSSNAFEPTSNRSSLNSGLHDCTHLGQRMTVWASPALSLSLRLIWFRHW